MPPGPPVCPSTRPRPLYSKISDSTRLSRGARDPRPVGRRRQFHERRPGAADEQHRAAAREQLAEARGARPRAAGEIHSHASAMPGHDRQRDAHLRLEAEPDARRPRARASACGRARARAPRTTAPPRSRARAARRGCCGARSPTVIGVSASARPATKPPTRPKRRRDEVVDERHRRHAHQRLRHEDAERVVAEHAHRQRLHPQRQRRLVDRHHAAAIERGEQEVVPARAHRAHRRAVVVVRPAVAAQRPQVEHAREHHQPRPARGAAHAQRERARRSRGAQRGRPRDRREAPPTAPRPDAAVAAAERVCQE